LGVVVAKIIAPVSIFPGPGFEAHISKPSLEDENEEE
jgi:hypothetical protein